MATAPSHHSSPRTGLSPNLAVYCSITNRILDSLEQGVVPWRKPWQGSEHVPCNAVSNRPYRGINLLLLSLAPYTDHRWLTFKQANALGGTVKRGEKATVVVLWKPIEAQRKDQESGEEVARTVPLLRFFTLFNAEQCENLSLSQVATSVDIEPRQRIERAEALVRAMPDPPRIEEGGMAAWYKPSLDLVRVPAIKSFESADSYYATLFHELGHATGHERRLARKGIMEVAEFGSEDYSREELIAELTSAFCCATLGLDNSLMDNSAGYIHGWLKALRNDAKAVVVAAGHAQKAADFIQNAGEAQDESELARSA